MKTERIALCLALALLVCTPRRVCADDALTLREAAAMALESLPQVSAAERRVEAARQRVWAARGAYAPTVQARAGLTKNYRDTKQELAGETGYQRGNTQTVVTQATASLVLVDFGARRHALRSQKAGVDGTLAELSAVQLAAVQDVAELYLTVLRDERRVADAELSVSIQERQVSVIERLVERRARPEVDLQRAQIQLQAARDNVEVLRAETRRDRVNLALALGVQSVEGVALAPLEDDALAFTGSPEQAAAQALARRPEGHAAKATARALREQVRATGASIAPTLSIEASTALNHDLTARGNLPKTHATQSTIGVFLTFNGLDPALWATRRAQAADADGAQLDARAVERALRAEALAALEEERRTEAAVERAAHLREGTQAALEAQQKRYELGAGSLLELLDAQALEQGARAQLIDAELAHRVARVRLLARCGLLNERALATKG